MIKERGKSYRSHLPRSRAIGINRIKNPGENETGDYRQQIPSDHFIVFYHFIMALDSIEQATQCLTKNSSFWFILFY